MNITGLWPRALATRLGERVDGASLAVFRVAFGGIMAWEVVRYFQHDWIPRYWMVPRFHFTYFGFGWVHPWPGQGMYIHFAVMGVLALLVAVGLWYRVAAPLFWLAFTYVFLLEEARYLNHFYAASLFALLLSVTPAHAVWSLDAWRRKPPSDGTIPVWSLWIFRAQVGLIYFFGGVAKLNADWVRGEPMRSWLLARQDLPLIGLIVRSRLELLIFSYGGLFFDLLIVPALLWRRTRPFAFVVAVMFHVINSQLFAIGIFPWMMIAATTLFFAPDWPRKLGTRLSALGARQSTPAAPSAERRVPSPMTFGLLALYLLIQIFVPLRHFLYPGSVHWTEEGHRFSWHMKLRDKEGAVLFLVTNRRTGETSTVDPEKYLEPWQASKMAATPDMILQFAHFLADTLGSAPGEVEVRAQSIVSLNGRDERPLVDARVDLAAQPRTLWPAFWITDASAAPLVRNP